MKCDYEAGSHVSYFKPVGRAKYKKLEAIFLGLSPKGKARIAITDSAHEDGLRISYVPLDLIEKRAVKKDE